MVRMSVEVAQAILNITPSMRGLQGLIDREFRNVNSRRAGQQAGDDYSGGFGSSAKKLTGILAGAFAAVKIGDFAKSAIDQASDLNEAGTKMQVVFGDANAAVQEFAGKGAKALGLSSLQAQNAAANFGVFGKAAGLAGKDQSDFSTGLTQLAVDMASFSNTTPDDAIEALSAGLRGESEPLRRYGVLLDDASLRQEALGLGIISTTKNSLTPQQRVLAAHSLILKQTSDAQGDFARTSDGLANQQRILSAQWTDMKGKLGAAFLPAVNAVVHALNDDLFPILDSVGAKASAAWHVLSTGDFPGATAGLGEEDSPLVGALFKVRDTYAVLKPQIEAAWNSLKTGDNYGVSADEQSPLVRIALMLREFGLGTFDKLKVIFGNLWNTAKDLWPAIQSIAGSISDAVGSLSGAGLGAFTGFLGISEQLSGVLQDILVPAFDWIAKFMKDNPAVVLTLVGALVAYRIVTQGIAIATQAWAAIQAVLNAVMNANPITLVVIALVALAAAVVWAYTNVGWFKDAVDASWSFIKDATNKLWNNVLKPAFQWISDNIHVVGDFFVAMWNAAQPVFDFLKESWDNFVKVIQGVIDVVVGVFTGDWQRAWDGVKQIFTAAWDQIVNFVTTAWTLISGAFTAAWNVTVKPVLGWIQEALTTTGRFFMDLWNNTVSKVWTWIQDKIDTVWKWLNQNVFAPLNLAVATMGTFFNNLWTTVQTVWTNISTFFGNVAQGITDAVTKVKQGITDIKAAIDGFFERFKNWGGTEAGGVLGNIDLNPHATGTVVPGYAPGVDNYPALLSPGEAVLVPQLTRQLGPSRILAANAAAYTGGDGASMLRLATGGVIGGQQAGALVADQALKLLKQKQDEMKAAIDTASSLGSAAVNLSAFNNSQDPSSFGWKRASGIVPFNYAGMLTGVAGGTTGLWSALLSALAPSIPGGIKTLGGYENRANVNNPSMASFHSYGLAMDVNAPWNPNGVSGYGRAGQYIIPSGAAHSLAARYGMLWGGDFNGTPDPMHFEIHLPPSAIGAAAAGTATSTPAVGYNAGAGVEQWRPLGLDVLSKVGAYKGMQLTQYINQMMNQIRTESSGNPNAINLTDSNAQRGDPSIGLLQVIGSTFRNALRGTPFEYLIAAGQRDPRASLTSSTLYSLSRYRNLAAAWRGVAYANGGIVPGFGSRDSVPGLLTPGEGVFTAPQTDAIITHAKALEAGFAGHMPVVINLDNSDPLQVAVGRMIEEGVQNGMADASFRMATAAMQS